MNILIGDTEALVKFAAVTTVLRGSNWTVKDVVLLGTMLAQKPDRQSDEQVKEKLKELGWSWQTAKRINQLKNEWYRSLDYKASHAE